MGVDGLAGSGICFFRLRRRSPCRVLGMGRVAVAEREHERFDNGTPATGEEGVYADRYT